MRLLSVHIIEAETCGSLLKDFRVGFRPPGNCTGAFAPICLIGRNGAGKSQFMQVIAEMFQAAFHAVVPGEERADGNESLQFELIYALRPPGEDADVRVRISRKVAKAKQKPKLRIERLVNREWEECELSSSAIVNLLPAKVVGYSSGDNETLSLPFLLSRSGYANDVRNAALNKQNPSGNIPDTRLMLIDYGTHLEVLVANLLLGGAAATENLLDHARLKRLHSFRCVVQLRHGAVKSLAGGKGVQVTDELKLHIQSLRDCATCYHYEPKAERYTLDFLVNDNATPEAFGAFWDSALSLYSALHKLAMLNDLAIPRETRRRFARDTKERRFASRLPEPQDEEKVFRFASVRFAKDEAAPMVDYVSLSDGEHQFAQVLGTFRMISSPNVLFLLDEPESHFNPQWRIKFVNSLLGLETPNGNRTGDTEASQQDALLTTHAPFVPCDLPRDRVLIFHKDEAGKITCDRPGIETRGSEFDAILQDCFDVAPPISDVAREEIEKARQSNDPAEIRAAMEKLGYSTEKALLADRLRQLTLP